MTDNNFYGGMYLTVRHDFGAPVHRRLVPVKVTRKYPSVVNVDEVVVQINVSVPKTAFLALDGGIVQIPHESVPTTAEVTGAGAEQ